MQTRTRDCQGNTIQGTGYATTFWLMVVGMLFAAFLLGLAAADGDGLACTASLLSLVATSLAAVGFSTLAEREKARMNEALEAKR